MLTDIVVPKDNDSKFVAIAERLGYNRLVVVGSSSDSAFPIISATAKPGKGLVIIKAGENNRGHFEDKRISCIYGLELHQNKDFIHHRNSGMNQVLCKLAKKNDIAIGFSFSHLLQSSGQKKARLLGRMKQNAKFCRKYNLPIVIASFAESPFHMRSPVDLVAFGAILGFHPSDCRQAVSGGIVKFK